MKPARFFLPLSHFLMRLGIAFFIYVTYFDTVLNFKLNQFSFYFSSIHIIFGVLLLAGTFTKKQTLTVLSTLILFLLAAYQLFTYSGNLLGTSFMSLLLYGMLVFYFLCNGNRN